MTDEKTPPVPPPGDPVVPGPAAETPRTDVPPPPSSGAGAGAPPPPPPGAGGHGAGGASAGGPGSAPPPPGAPPPPPPAGPADGNRQLMLVLSYLWVLALIPYLTEQNDPEVKWHARHGLVLTVAEIILNVGLFVLSMIPGIGCLFTIVWMIIPVFLVALHVIALMKALKGERFLIPGISQYADQIP